MFQMILLVVLHLNSDWMINYVYVLFSLVFCDFLEVFWSYKAERTFFRSGLAFVNITTYEAYIFLCHNRFVLNLLLFLILNNSKLFLMQR